MTTQQDVSAAITELTSCLNSMSGELRVCCKKDQNQAAQMEEEIKNWADTQSYCVLGSAPHDQIKTLKTTLMTCINREAYTQYQMCEMRKKQKCILDVICKMARDRLLCDYLEGAIAAQP